MISIIVPTFNERENLLSLIRELVSIFAREKIKSEILVIDDNSRDKTGIMARRAFRRDKNIHIFIRKNGTGLATAILYGINKSKGSVVIGMDADFNHPPEKIPELLQKVKNHDLVVASRFIKGGGMEDKTRYIFTYIFNLFLKHILGFPTMDNMSGFYAMRREKLFKLPLRKIYQGYGEYHLRLVWYAKRLGFKITEIPVFYPKRKYGKSKSNLFKMFFTYLAEAIDLKLKSARIFEHELQNSSLKTGFNKSRLS